MAIIMRCSVLYVGECNRRFRKRMRGPGNAYEGINRVKAQERVKFQKFKQKREETEKKIWRNSDWWPEVSL